MTKFLNILETKSRIETTGIETTKDTHLSKQKQKKVFLLNRCLLIFVCVFRRRKIKETEVYRHCTIRSDGKTKQWWVRCLFMFTFSYNWKHYLIKIVSQIKRKINRVLLKKRGKKRQIETWPTTLTVLYGRRGETKTQTKIDIPT